MTFEQETLKAAHKDWGNPEAAEACGFTWHEWTQLHNQSYRPTARQWVALRRWLHLDVPDWLVERVRAEQSVAA